MRRVFLRNLAFSCAAADVLPDASRYILCPTAKDCRRQEINSSGAGSLVIKVVSSGACRRARCHLFRDRRGGCLRSTDGHVELEIKWASRN